MLNVQKGQMYGFVSHTWNTVKGKCPHDCQYCYMKAFPQKELHFVESELKTDLGSRNFIFVGSSCDMFAWDVESKWIEKTLEHCRKFPNNRYLFQSKNPAKMKCFVDFIPKGSLLATTIETNRDYSSFMGNAPSTVDRANALRELSDFGFETMVTIEPVMDFSLEEMVSLVLSARPKIVTIGADSKSHSLPEPDKDKLEQLSFRLSKYSEVRQKPNLKRILNH